MNDDKITCMYFDKRFTDKPQGSTIGWVQKNLGLTYIAIEDLANGLCNGASFKPGALQDGMKAEHWKQQQLFGLDFDHNTKIAEKYQKAVSLGMVPCFLYTTFSHTEAEHKFRMVFCNETVIMDAGLRDKLQATLMGIMEDVDPVCFNRDRLFFGGKGKTALYPDYGSRINGESIIEKYWKDEYGKYIPIRKDTKKNKLAVSHKSTKTNGYKKAAGYSDNTDAISSLNVGLLQERLGIGEDKGDTDRRRSSLLVSQKSPRIEYVEDGTIHKTQFSNENEMYQYINSIDLHEYLGVPEGSFHCVLPTHQDTEPSAHIYETDDGTQIYKCFGCKQSRTIISITEQLAQCRRSQAIEFIKQVYRIDYKPSEWVEQQRRLMIDSAIYLDSDEFKQTFPRINKLIRTRKADIQRILLHMTKYVSDGLQHEGKPLFYASIPNLMKICGRNNRNIMSQSITLFALLNMLNKVELNCIPENELKKAKHISAQYGFKKIVNFYQVEEYGFTTLESSEKIAETLIENNVSLKGLSREYVMRTFGVELADRVFPQYKVENKRGTSAKSDFLTGEIAFMVLETIKRQGYIYERDINTNGIVGRQWKKSIQEILDIYNLQKVKLNKDLKEKLQIQTPGYPNVIIREQTDKMDCG